MKLLHKRIAETLLKTSRLTDFHKRELKRNPGLINKCLIASILSVYPYGRTPLSRIEKKFKTEMKGEFEICIYTLVQSPCVYLFRKKPETQQIFTLYRDKMGHYQLLTTIDNNENT